MSTKTEIARLTNAKSAIKSAIEGKGITVPSDTKLDGMAALIEEIETGIDTSDATAVAEDIVKDKTAYVNGVKVTGTRKKVTQIFGTVTSKGILLGMNQARFTGEVNKAIAADKGASFDLSMPASDLGDAGDADVAKGKTYTSVRGFKRTGTLEVPATEEQTVELSMLSGNQIIQPTSGKVMSKVTVQKPVTLLPENIKKDVVIGGVVGTLESGGGGGGETTQLQNVITFEYTPTSNTIPISHDVLVGVGIDTEDKFFKIIGISIFPKNGDVDYFYVSYGGALDKTKFSQQLKYNHSIASSGALTFYNLSGTLPYQIALATSSNIDVVNKTLVVTLLLSE